MECSRAVDNDNQGAFVQDSECSSQGFGYICGFLARKLSSKYLELGSKSSELDFNLDEVRIAWIRHLSNGGLTIPSDAFVTACHQFEGKFNSFHGSHKNNIDQDENVIQRMCDILVENFPSWPREVLMLFAKTRTFIRIKYLNHKIKATEAKAHLRHLSKIGHFQF